MAQRSGFDGVFLDTDGTPLVNISASVLDGSNSPVTVYAAKSGSAEQAQPIITTSATPGLVRFWAEPGFYQVEISDNQIPARFASRKIPFDAVAGDTTLGDEGISLDQIPEITTAKLPEIPNEKIQDAAITSEKLNLSKTSATNVSNVISADNTEQQAIITGSLDAGTYLVLFSGTVSLPETVTTCYVRVKAASTTLQTINPKITGTDASKTAYVPISILTTTTTASSGTFSVTIQAPVTGFGSSILASSQLTVIRIG